MNKIYWYKKPNGEILDIGETHAWQVHAQYVDPRLGYKYLGWSDGKFILAVKAQNKAKKTAQGIMKDFTKTMKNKIYEAIDKEIENANPEPPQDRSREEFSKKGGIGKVTTPGLEQRMR